MGKHDSTKTRVQPAFDAIGCSAENWNRFFRLFPCGARVPTIQEGGVIEIRYGSKSGKGHGEAVLPSSKDRLLWCVKNLKTTKLPGSLAKSDETNKKRAGLKDGRQEIIDEACRLLHKYKGRKRDWFVLEGSTHPDIYIETKNFIAVGEAKRKEPHLTTFTTWFKDRDQLIRHVDALIDQEKTVFSFLITEKEYGELGNYEKLDYFEKSLPHRDIKAQKRAKESYLGRISWDDLTEAFPKIHFSD